MPDPAVSVEDPVEEINANLRRAVSTAYYAVFHGITVATARSALRNAHGDEIFGVARHVSHTSIRQVAACITGDHPPKHLDTILIRLRRHVSRPSRRPSSSSKSSARRPIATTWRTSHDPQSAPSPKPSSVAATTTPVDLSAGLSNMDPALLDLLTRAVADADSPAVRTNPPTVRSQTRLSGGQVNQLVEDYKRGVPLRDLCDEWNINKDTLYRHLKKAGLEPGRYADPEDEVITQARGLYESGLSLADTGKRVGLSPESVRKYLVKAGVQIRPRNGWQPKD